jgi:hypothetical protein
MHRNCTWGLLRRRKVFQLNDTGHTIDQVMVPLRVYCGVSQCAFLRNLQSLD